MKNSAIMNTNKHDIKQEWLDVKISSAGDDFIGQESRFGDQVFQGEDEFGIHGRRFLLWHRDYKLLIFSNPGEKFFLKL